MSEEGVWKLYTDRRGTWRITTKNTEIPNNRIVREFFSQKDAEKQKNLLNSNRGYTK